MSSACCLLWQLFVTYSDLLLWLYCRTAALALRRCAAVATATAAYALLLLELTIMFSILRYYRYCCAQYSAVQGTYIPAQQFEGRKLGYVFTKGAHGLGYYMDAAQAVRISPQFLVVGHVITLSCSAWYCMVWYGTVWCGMV